MSRIARTDPRYVRILLVEQLRKGINVSGDDASNVVVNFENGTQHKIFDVTRPTAAVYAGLQIEQVLASVDQRADRMAEIILQQNDILSFLGSTMRIHDVSHGWSLEMLRATQDVATLVHSQIKHRLSTRRPVELFPETAPITQTPQHSSLPSGHSVEVSAVAYMLSRMSGKSEAETLSPDNLIMRMAERIAVNRHVAGVQFPFESFAGFLLGVTLGRICHARLFDQPETLWGYDITTGEMADESFSMRRFAEVFDCGTVATWLTQNAISFTPTATPELQETAARVAGEWTRGRPTGKKRTRASIRRCSDCRAN